MKTYLVFPELFIRYFFSKDEKVLNRIEGIFKKVEAGKIKLLLTEGLFFLLAIELEKRIAKKRDVADYLESILNIHNLKIRNEIILRETVGEMRKGKGFIAAYRSVAVPLLSLNGVYN